VFGSRKPRDNRDMTILPRLVAIALKKYATHPDEPQPAVRMLLRNVMRLAVLHLGAEQAKSLALETLQERQA